MAPVAVEHVLINPVQFRLCCGMQIQALDGALAAHRPQQGYDSHDPAALQGGAMQAPATATYHLQVIPDLPWICLQGCPTSLARCSQGVHNVCMQSSPIQTAKRTACKCVYVSIPTILYSLDS